MIAIKPSHKGLLHKALGIKEGKKISIADMMSDKRKAKASGDTAEEKRDTFAINARGWKHA